MKKQPVIEAAPNLSLTTQLEDYLEAIAELQEADRVARAKDIAERLGITRGTVTSALRSLNEKGLINYQPYSHITLTKAGEEIAARIIHRHKVLSRYLSKVLKLPSELAEDNACRAEHILDKQVIDRLVHLMEFLERCPRMDTVWKDSFADFCPDIEDPDPAACRDCLGRCLAGLYQKD